MDVPTAAHPATCRRLSNTLHALACLLYKRMGPRLRFSAATFHSASPITIGELIGTTQAPQRLNKLPGSRQGRSAAIPSREAVLRLAPAL